MKYSSENSTCTIFLIISTDEIFISTVLIFTSGISSFAQRAMAVKAAPVGSMCVPGKIPLCAAVNNNNLQLLLNENVLNVCNINNKLSQVWRSRAYIEASESVVLLKLPAIKVTAICFSEKISCNAE